MNSTEVRALLLTDVVDSTRLAQTLGDAESAALWLAHDRLARDLLPRWRGREIDKTDGFLLLFADAGDAAGYALDYHRALATSGTALRARAGLHVGPVILRDNSPRDVALGAKPVEVDGLAKSTAARVMSLAQGGQTLATAAAHAALAGTPLRVQSHGHWRLKGVAEPIELFEIGADEAPFTPPPDGDKAYRVARKGGVWLPVRLIDNNLPEEVASFVGRQRELADLVQRLAQTRLLTLSGIGGIGKTRLGLQLATAVMGEFPDGVWLVELAPLSDPALVAQTVATVLGLKEAPGKPMARALVEHLEDRRLLLLLDNCEHLLDACATLADAIVRGCPGVHVLATSRELLGLHGEQAYRVPSLSLPDPKQASTTESIARFEAVQLFTDRALLARPDFRITGQNAPALASICCRLDGIPLAIELAAARVRSLSVQEIDAKLNQRFRLLTAGSRTAAPRQQTLRSMIDWSFDLLNQAERAMLIRLAVFAGGWTLDAAEHVCQGHGIDDGAALDLLASLADKSLVLTEERDGETRYGLLETVRQYARDRLVERDELKRWRDRHLSCFLQLAERAEPLLIGADQRVWFDRLETEHDNLRSALAWSSGEGGDAESGLRLAGALWWFWSVRGHPGEGRGWISGLLAAARDASPASRAKALGGAGVLAREQADYVNAQALQEDSLGLWRQLGDRQGVASSLSNLGSLARERGDYRRARALHEESLAIRREVGDRKGVATSLNNLGLLVRELGDHPSARRLYQESLAIDREIDDRRSIAVSLNNLGGIASDQGDHAAARALHEESLAIRRELGDRRGIASSLTNLGEVARGLQDYATARSLLDDGLAIRRELGDRRGIAISLCTLGTVAQDQGDLAAAQALYEESLTIRRALGDQWGVASSLNYLGSVALERGEPSVARTACRESLSISRELGDRWGLAESLTQLASAARVLAGPLRAAGLWGVTERLREEISAALTPAERARNEREVVAARSALANDAAFDRAWQQGRALTLEQAIELALEG